MACVDGPDDFVTTHVEAAVRGVLDAVNDRDFDPSPPSSPWHALAEDFKYEDRFTAYGKAAAIEAFGRAGNQWPDFRIVITDMSTTICRKKGRASADCYVGAMTMGGPSLEGGVMRKLFIICKFECRGGMWYWIGETSMRGLGPADMTAW